MARRTVYGWVDPYDGKTVLSTEPKSVSSRAVNRYDTREAAEAEVTTRNPRPPLEPMLMVEWEE